MSNMIVLAFVAIWNYNVSMEMPPIEICVWTKLFSLQTGVRLLLMAYYEIFIFIS